MFRHAKADKSIWVIFGEYYDSPYTWVKSFFN